MKKILFLILSIFTYSQTFATNIQSQMLGVVSTDANNLGVTGSKQDPLESVVTYAREFIFDILYLIVIGVFLYLGARLVTARGKPDEFKKVIMAFIYVIVGLAVIPLAYAAVRLIASLDI